jgi:Flp pilus assembly protein protease CpaA
VALPFYHLRIFGGGDFKLIVAMGTFTGIGYLLPTMGLILGWGGLFALVHALTSGRISHVASNMVSVLLVRKPLPEPLLHRIPFTLPIFFGWLSLLVLLNLGVLK